MSIVLIPLNYLQNTVDNLGKELFTELLSGDVALPEKFRVCVSTCMPGEDTVVNNMCILKNECKYLKSEKNMMFMALKQDG